MEPMMHTGRRSSEVFTHDRTDWQAAIWAGLLAGLVFMMLEMLMVMVFMGQSPWGPPRMIGAMALGRDALPPPASFDMGIVMTAMMIHFPLAIVHGLILGWIVHRLGSTNATLIGGLFGLAVYFIDFYLIAPLMFPWFVDARNWISLVSHLVYGLVLGGTYAALRRHKPVAG